MDSASSVSQSPPKPCLLHNPVLVVLNGCPFHHSAAAQSLEILDLSYNRLTGPLPEAFAAMGSLRELLIDVNQLSGSLPEVWASLPNLQKIFLSENQLTGSLPESWGDIQGLTDLWVEYNKVRDRDSMLRSSNI